MQIYLVLLYEIYCTWLIIDKANIDLQQQRGTIRVMLPLVHIQFYMDGCVCNGVYLMVRMNVCLCVCGCVGMSVCICPLCLTR